MALFNTQGLQSAVNQLIGKTDPNSITTIVSTGAFGTVGSDNWNNTLVETYIEVLSGKYKGKKVFFPVEKCSWSCQQDVTQHKFPQIGGASLESMGRGPIVFKVTASLTTGNIKTSAESWKDLFPVTSNLLFNILNDNTAPLLYFQHPTKGIFLCKPASASGDVNPAVIRNGEILDFELIETLNDDLKLDNTTSGLINNAKLAAVDFAANVAALDPPPPSGDPLKKFNLLNTINNIAALIDQGSLFLNTVLSPIQDLLFQISQLESSILNFKKDQENNFSKQGVMMQQLNNIKSGAYSLVNYNPVNFATNSNLPEDNPTMASSAALADLLQQQQIAQSSQQNSELKELKVYILEDNMTLGQVSRVLKNNIGDLLNLNPGISKTVVIPLGTQVVYFS